jgi:hypothetical protein
MARPADVLLMADKRRQGDLISLEVRRRRRRELRLKEANRQMIEAEHALFVALRMAGHRGPSNNGLPLLSIPRAATIVPISRMRARRKRAA